MTKVSFNDVISAILLGTSAHVDQGIRNIGNVILRPFEFDEEYFRKWNIHGDDFVQLYTSKKGKISDSVYRVGGFGSQLTYGYFMLLKYVESKYEDSITKDPKQKFHLESHWCILDKEGNEKKVFDPYKSPYLAGGQIYSLDQKYYNIESGVFYCKSYTTMKTSEFIFLDNAYDEDVKKRGVMKINKFDGTFELFK